MDFGKSNHVPNSSIRDFDLNKPCMEELDLNTENESSLLIHNINSTPRSDTDNMNMLGGDNEVHQSSAIVVANSGTGPSSSEDTRPFHARHYVTSISFGPNGTARGMIGGRRRYRRRGGRVLLQSDPNRYCTNYYCRTRKTPLWRKGPLGPKTLCNACGIDYMKQVTSTGSGITTFPGPEVLAADPAANNDASSSALPTEGDH